MTFEDIILAALILVAALLYSSGGLCGSVRLYRCREYGRKRLGNPAFHKPLATELASKGVKKIATA